MLIYNEMLAELHIISPRDCNELPIINVINHGPSAGGMHFMSKVLINKHFHFPS